MRTVGEILKNERIRRNLALDSVEKATKIRLRYLEALEKNDFSKIPGGATVAKGFIKNYAEFLGLSAKDLLAVFRRDFQEDKTGQIVPRGMAKPFAPPKILWTPKLATFFSLIFLFLVLGGYLFYQYFLFLAPPRLTLFSPQQSAKEKQDSVWVRGKTDSDATLFINKEMKSLEDDGSFEEKVFLSLGENEIVIEAVSRRGNKTQIIRQVQYEP